MSNLKFKNLTKLKKGDCVAIISPSFAAPGAWPQVYELGLERVRDVFGLKPTETPTTKRIGSTTADRTKDLINVFQDSDIKAVITTLGGDDQVTYVNNLPSEPFSNNPKPFFGYSDNTHLINFLWLSGVPSFYGGALFTEFAEQKKISDFTTKYLKHALFDSGEIELLQSPEFNDEGLDWGDLANLTKQRRYQKNEGWYWDGRNNTEGITWGGCLESIGEMLMAGVKIPTLEQFSDVVLFIETSEGMPSASEVFHVFRALGERGILERVKGVLVGRPKAWEFDNQRSDREKDEYKLEQRNIIIEFVRKYNSNIPIIQNMDFGHTSPQIPLPVGKKATINSDDKRIFIEF